MTIAVEPVPSTFVPSPDLIKRFTVDQYHRLIDADVFAADARVELLEGWIVYKMTHNPLHDSTVDRIQEILRDRISKTWRVRVQSAITTRDSEPEPDIVIARGPASRYAKRHPVAKDIELIVEVADSSLDRDRNEKGPLYARAGISVYWIVNLQESVVEVYSSPTRGRRYAALQRFRMKDSVPLAIAGQTLPPIPVKELLP
jgi:Uma2 family endonuclease